MTTMSLIIPWRGGDPHRERLLEWNLRRWEYLLPDAQIVIGEDDSEPFNRARARNRAAAAATGDILIVADADTATSATGLFSALVLASGGDWCLPYTWYYNLNETATSVLLDQSPFDPIERPVDGFDHCLAASVAGVLVIPRAAFDAAGGYCEKFDGWGYEDNAFAAAADTLWRPHVRRAGYVLHMWHPVGPDEAFGSPGIKDRQRLWLKFQRAAGHPDMMRRLCGLSLGP